MTSKKTRKSRLRSGFTTGAAAAAAAKAALEGILAGSTPKSTRVAFLTEGHVEVPVHRFSRLAERQARCSVVKDAGDDPDVTHGAEIGALVTYTAGPPGSETRIDVLIRGGRGVGTVTKPGLGIPVGDPAINSGPRVMIRNEVSGLLESRGKSGRVEVEVFVPDGERLALKTLNARLGILGGISILGTTGIVRPMSHDAYEATIHAALSVAAAAGLEATVFTTGRRSERYAMELFRDIPPEGFIQIGDFFKVSMAAAKTAAISRVTLAVFFGKAVKMAMGVPHTHAAKSSMTLEHLRRWAHEATGSPDLAGKVASANTARHAFEYIHPRYPAVIEAVGRRMIRSAAGFAGPGIRVRGIIFDFEGKVCFDSGHTP
ncbi:MAG: cobalt-precorrin-5B (C(1))-methyltransferase CbiD [Desulfobacterales bacterium]